MASYEEIQKRIAEINAREIDKQARQDAKNDADARKQQEIAARHGRAREAFLAWRESVGATLSMLNKGFEASGIKIDAEALPDAEERSGGFIFRVFNREGKRGEFVLEVMVDGSVRHNSRYGAQAGVWPRLADFGQGQLSTLIVAFVDGASR